MPPMRANASSGQAAITSSASGKRARGGELRARVAHERAPAGGPRQPRERRRVVHGAEDHEPRRGRHDVDEQRRLARLARLRALGPEQLLGGLDAGRVELRRRRARRRCCRRRARAASRRCAGPAITVTSAARPSAAAMSANSDCRLTASNSSTNTSISPPHGSPTSHASLSAIPKWSSRGSSRAQHLGGGLHDGALDAAAGDGAGHLAVLVHGHLRAGRARRRALHADHGRDRDPVAAVEPRPHVVEHVLHPSPPSISSAKSANDDNRVPGQEMVDVRKRRLHAARRAARSPGCAFSGLSQIRLCAQRCRRAISAASCSGSPRSQPSESRTTIAPRPSRRPCSRLSVASASPMRVPPDQSCGRAGGAVERAVGVAAGELRGHAREARAEHERLDAPARGHAGLHVLEQHARVGLHRAGHVADEHERARPLGRLAPVALERVAGRAERGADGAAQVRARRVRRRAAAAGRRACGGSAARARPRPGAA